MLFGVLNFRLYLKFFFARQDFFQFNSSHHFFYQEFSCLIQILRASWSWNWSHAFFLFLIFFEKSVTSNFLSFIRGLSLVVTVTNTVVSLYVDDYVLVTYLLSKQKVALEGLLLAGNQMFNYVEEILVSQVLFEWARILDIEQVKHLPVIWVYLKLSAVFLQNYRGSSVLFQNGSHEIFRSLESIDTEELVDVRGS